MPLARLVTLPEQEFDLNLPFSPNDTDRLIRYRHEIRALRMRLGLSDAIIEAQKHGTPCSRGVPGCDRDPHKESDLFCVQYVPSAHSADAKPEASSEAARPSPPGAEALLSAATCIWSEDAASWQAGCDSWKSFQFEDAGPEENGFTHCPYCGKTLVAIPADEEDKR